MKCTVCCYEIPSGSDFCPICGAWNIPENVLPAREQFEAVTLNQNEASLSPQELEEVEVLRPDVLARWRIWGVPEATIEAIIRQRRWVLEQRRVEERITVPNFAYMMPRLEPIEMESWGFSKAIDTDGYIRPRVRTTRDKIGRIDRAIYRYEWYEPMVGFASTSYPLAEEIANMMKITVGAERMVREGRTIILYRTRAWTSRAVRVCQLIEPHLTVAKKRERANEVLTTYRDRPTKPIE